jgi:PAB-dependent poly(A)-specific ribonuclease subunit 3
MISNGALDNEMYGVSPFQQGRTFITPPRNPPVYYNNSSYSQPSMMNRDGTLTNTGNVPNPNTTNTYLPDLHSHSVQNKFPHANNMLGTSRLGHLGVGGPFSSLGPVSSHARKSLQMTIDAAAAVDNNARISPENNLDFYAYSQATPYSMQQLTDEDLLIPGGGANHDEKERVIPPDMPSVRQVRPDFAYFMSEELRAELIRRNQLLTACASLDVAAAMPERVGDYYNLMPLDSSQANVPHKSRTFRYQTLSYKATHIRTNAICYLKRIMGCKLPTTRLYDVVEAWKKIVHANIVQLREVFLTKDFDDEQPSIVFVYDYIPCSETLQKRHFNSNNSLLKGWANPYNISGEDRPFSAGKGTSQSSLLTESLIWEYVVQISSFIRTLHGVSLACRCLYLSRILVDGDSRTGRGKSRIWLSGVGIADILDGAINGTVHQHIQNDLQDFGRLILMLACNSIVGAQKEHLQTSLEIVQRNYSHDLKNLILHFLIPSNTLKVKHINECMPMIGARFYAQIDNLHVRGDILENDLAKELDCGRLFRLICKLDALLERPEYSMNQAWSETGDRYILKLFRDFVFHSVGFDGEPIVDIAHIVQCLNKFDAGSHDKICLTSRDEQNVIIVSYSELHQAFERAFTELMNYGAAGSS